MPDLFGSVVPTSAGGAVEQRPNEDCSAAFDLFYKQSFSQLRPPPRRVPVALSGNESARANWGFFFNTGGNGSEGYAGCFRQNAANPSQ